MIERWKQVRRAGEVTLDTFGRDELAAVMLDPDAVPPEVRGRALQGVTPLLGRLEAERGGGAGASASLRSQAESVGLARENQDDQVLAAAAARLEKLGYLRPGAPGRQVGPIADELAGWSADPSGGSALRQVTLAGDLGIITRLRAQPYWVTEVSTSPEPTRPQLGANVLLARLYAAFRPQAALVERPLDAAGAIPPFQLLWEGSVLISLATWCGADLSSYERGDQPDTVPREAHLDGPTAELASRFTKLVQLRIARGHGQQVLLTRLLVATGDGGHWVLEGEQGEQAVRTTVRELGNRIAALLSTPPGEAGPPGTGAGPAARG
jgi:hypothetical protein